MQTLRKRSSPCKYKNEPSRFLGDGVSFKAKLIGILEVGEARGDRMCQEALADLKMAIRAAGEHKQRITINIAIDGLRLRDEKTTDCLYHHPVHKISFIAQDMTDSRAFGYIFGSPDTGHRFFGIKTDKAAGQVVVAMRDLFQVVFELKKKEIELAKLQIEQQQFKSTAGKSMESLVGPKSDSGGAEVSSSSIKSRSTRDELRENGCITTLKKKAQQTSEVIADLLDLEIELNSIQQGIHQMEKITPSDPFGPDATKEGATSSFHDPFEDSFSPPPVTTTVKHPKPSSSGQSHPALLPPPPSSTRSDLMSTSGRQGRSSGASKRNAVASLNFDTGPLSPSNVTTPNSASTTAPYASTETWFDSRSDPLFGDNDLPLTAVNNSLSTVSTSASVAAAASSVQACCKKEQAELEASSQIDVFTELDPLGTGRSRPYIDKKDFFQELKNPPKKVLKDLAGELKDGEPAPLFPATFEPAVSVPPLSGYSRVVHSPPISSLPSCPSRSPDIANLDPFADADPFGETDPFVDEIMPDSASSFPPDGTDPFDTCFADFTMFGSQQSDKKGNAASVYHGPLRVSLPPEKAGSSLLPPPPTSRRSSPTPSAKPKSPRLTKQMSATTATTMVRLPSPKSVRSKGSRRLAKQTTLGDTRSGSMLHSPPSPLRNLADEERLSSSSLELTDIAPEPPPRPAASKPPPLPPKRQQQSGLSLKPPPRPPPTEQYDYINHHDEADDSTSPPLPVPVRRPCSRSSEIPRPRQQAAVEFTAFSLPPPPAPSVAKEEKKLKNSGNAANLTLKQLTKMNISELAVSLNVSPGHLSKMTLQELANYLASVSADNSSQASNEQRLDSDNNVKRENYSALRESVDDETFKADFDSHFTDFTNTFTSKSSEDVFQEAPFDKYAVFRELVEQEVDAKDVLQDAGVEPQSGSCKDSEKSMETEVKDEEKGVLARSDSAMAEEGRRPGEEEEDEEEEEEEEFGEAGTGSDKYAALREICSEPPPADESDKEDSMTEVAGEKAEENFNLLTLSRQQSESPESPVQETTIVRESQSIIESTILEEEVVSDSGSHIEKPTVAAPCEELITPSKLSTDTSPVPKSPTLSKTPERIAPPSELPLPARDKISENQEKEERWAKFEDSNFDTVESRSHNEEATSPWSLEGREFPAGKVYRESPEAMNPRSRRRFGSRRESPWHDDDDDDDDEDMEDWEGRGHRENGWRDDPRGVRPRKHSPWGRGPSHRTSPWEDDDEEGDVEEYDDVIYKTRPPPRATSSERRSRRPPSWEDDEADYDEPRPRRVVGWAGSQQERERRREYEDKRERSGSRGEYMDRRRWEREEEESNKCRRNVAKYPMGYATWGERGSRKAAQERRSRESAMRRKQYEQYWHYRDHRPSTEYDYEEPESYDVRYKAKKTGAWPKRPSSATDMRKASRRGFQSPSSSHSHDAEPLEENFPERRFRTQSSEQSKCWSNDPHDFNSDQEADFAGEKERDSFEQRAHTLHSRRNQRQKRGARLPSEDFFSPQQKSPFEDDFSTHSFHASEFSSIDSPSAESNRKQELLRRKDSQLSEPELKLPSSSPMEELQQSRGRESPPSRNKASLGSSRRQSPFEDDFTPPDTRRGSGRVPSSISSDVSEHRRSPHDDSSTPHRTHVTTRGGSLAVDDVFLPTSSVDPTELESEPLDNKVFEPRRNERRGWSEEGATRPYSSMKTRLSVLRATDSNPNIKKSESVNIFARDNDPFDDDFFAEQQNAEHQTGNKLHSVQERVKNSAGSFSKWSEPFDNFDFKEED